MKYWKKGCYELGVDFKRKYKKKMENMNLINE